MKYRITLCALLITSNLFATELPDKKCYNLEKIMKDPFMKGVEVCKFVENFCTFTSPIKAHKSKINISYTRQIPCGDFYKLEKVLALPKKERMCHLNKIKEMQKKLARK